MRIDFRNKTDQEKLMFLIEFSCLFKKLRDKEKQVLCKLLYYQNKLLYDVLKDYDVKVQIREDLKISEHNFNNIISSLKKKNVIIDYKVNKPYIDFLGLINKQVVIDL